MIRSISENNLDFLTRIGGQKKIDTLVLVGSHCDLEEDIYWFHKLYPGVDKIVCFSQGRFSPINMGELQCIRKKYWPFKRYVEISQSGGVGEVINSLYEADCSRMPDIRRFYRVDLPLVSRLLPFKYFFAGVSVFIFKYLLFFRKFSVYERRNLNGVEIKIFYDDIYIKDHCGEDPGWGIRYSQILSEIKSFSKDERNILFLGSKGPQHLIAHKIINDLPDERDEITVCILSAFREQQKKVLSKCGENFLAEVI